LLYTDLLMLIVFVLLKPKRPALIDAVQLPSACRTKIALLTFTHGDQSGSTMTPFMFVISIRFGFALMSKETALSNHSCGAPGKSFVFSLSNSKCTLLPWMYFSFTPSSSLRNLPTWSLTTMPFFPSSMRISSVVNSRS